MYAIEVEQTGGSEVLSYVEKPRPSTGPGEVSIKAEAIGVNFVDTYFRSGLYPHELPFILGAEVAGTVAAVSEGVTALRVGDRVATADAVGAYAEYCVAPADVVASVPDAVTSDVAAAAILKGMTAHLLIKSVYPVQPDDTVLLHAGAGGVGLITDPVGDQPWDAGHHDGLHRAQGAAVAWGRCGGGARLPRRRKPVRGHSAPTHRWQGRPRRLRRRG
ncbi:MAG: NADPH:quinone reductase [Mycobacterium sp.]|jgi:NADPH2:quinone reductase|nr:NADPH:quinone reductase [Mycobacterium sp.]